MRDQGGRSASDNPWPEELRVKKNEKRLEVDFDTGETFYLSAEYLRVESPSAEVKGHGAEEPKTVGGKRLVGISNVEPVGNYAIRITFDDGHDTGLYSWDLLYKLGSEENHLWADYLRRLREKDMSRD